MSMISDKIASRMKAKPAATDPTPPVVPAAPPPPSAGTPTTPSAQASTTPGGPTPSQKAPGAYLAVLVDCFPVHGCPGRHVTAEEYTDSLRAEVAKEQRAPDWTVVEYFRGRGFLAAKVRAKLAGLNEHLVISIRSDSELFKAINEVLVDLADERVVGVR